VACVGKTWRALTGRRLTLGAQSGSSFFHLHIPQWHPRRPPRVPSAAALSQCACTGLQACASALAARSDRMASRYMTRGLLCSSVLQECCAHRRTRTCTRHRSHAHARARSWPCAHTGVPVTRAVAKADTRPSTLRRAGECASAHVAPRTPACCAGTAVACSITHAGHRTQRRTVANMHAHRHQRTHARECVWTQAFMRHGPGFLKPPPRLPATRSMAMVVAAALTTPPALDSRTAAGFAKPHTHRDK
jgi:hypothetical protein